MTEIIPFAGWPNTLRLANSQIELLITLDVGPRIISFKTAHGINVLKNYQEQLGGRDERDWMIRGGHRVWAAPEDAVITYELDNAPVSHDLLGETGVLLRNPASEKFGIAKELSVTIEDASTSTITINHTLRNEGSSPRDMASWALSVMAPGGTEIIPLPPLGEHPRDLLPNRRMVAWPYTDLTDARLHLGRRYIRIEQRDGLTPIKLGLAHTERWVAYHVAGALFLKAFDLDTKSVYPDLGCNFETYTADGMLEVESLGPLRTLAPGASTSHVETWWLFDAPGALPSGENAIADWLAPHLSKAGLA